MIACEILAWALANQIDKLTKSDGKYIYIFYLKHQFLKFSILYSLRKRRASEVAYYINLSVSSWYF